jgi:photoactive yellow protein
MDFHAPDALAALEESTDALLDGLAFGVVAMEPSGRVLAYNLVESQKAGLTPAKVIGQHFFQAVAPCTNNFMVAQRFESEPELDAVIDYTFTFRLRPTPVKLRLLRSARARRMYLLVDWRP